LCVLAVLAWVASCDGAVDDEERALLVRVAAGVAGSGAADALGERLPTVVDAMAAGDPADVELACRFLRSTLDRGGRELLARLSIATAARDGSLTVGENHVLQFLADLLQLSPKRFARLFHEVAGVPLPVPGDPSDLKWWAARHAGEQAKPAADAWGARADPASPESAPPPGQGRMTRAQALRLLGLEDPVTPDEAHDAYRRLAKVHHPDRYARLGGAAVAAATVAFERLNEAYQVLTGA
jgi:DnaJ like chaperone protein